LYVFSRKENVYNEFRNKTSSGGFCLNECLMQAGLECLPFGGVGESGIGRYHGKHSFETFSHPRFDLFLIQDDIA
jgi:aldehyde dehydrogenase (NAD+)